MSQNTECVLMRMSQNMECVCPELYKEIKIVLSLLKERIIELTNRDALVSGILLSHLRDVVKVTLKIEAYLEKIEDEITPDEFERLEQQIINASLCPAEFHYKKKRKRRHSTKS